MRKCRFEKDHKEFTQRGIISCFGCDLKLNLTYTEKLKERVAAVPLGTRQKILDLLWQGNTIGNVCKAVGLETDIVANIVSDNIGNYHFLRKEAVQYGK